MNRITGSFLPHGALVAIGFALAGVLLCLPVEAQTTLTWYGDGANPGGVGNWNTTDGRWHDGAGLVPWSNANNDTAVFGTTAGTVTLGEAITAGGLTFDVTGYTITGNTLTLAGTSPTITAGTGINATIASVIAGSTGLTKTGAGTLTLSGSFANTYTGATTVNAGNLVLSKSAGVVAVPGNITMANASSPNLWMTADGQLGGSGVLTFTGTGGNARFNVFGTAQSLAGLVENDGGRVGVVQNSEAINGAPSTTNPGTLTLNGSGNYTYNGYLRNWTGKLSVVMDGTGTQTFNINSNQPDRMKIGSTVWDIGEFTVNRGTVNIQNTFIVFGESGGSLAQYTQTGGTVNHTGSGGVYLSNGVGAPSQMTISGGTFNMPGTSSLFVIGQRPGGATLNVSGTAVVNLSAEMWIGRAAAGTLNLAGGTVNQSGQFFVVGNAPAGGTYNQTGGTYNYTGVNGSYIGNGSSGTGTMTVSGGTFNQTQNVMRVGQNGSSVGILNVGGGAGQALVSAPTVTFGANSASASGTVNLLANGRLITGTVNKGPGTGTFNFDGGTLQPSASNAAFMQGLTAAYVNAGGANIDTAGYNVTVAQPLLDGGGGGGLRKVGGGTLILGGSAANTYTGTTVMNGAGSYVSPNFLVLSKPADVAAIGGNVTMVNDDANVLYPTANNQFAAGSVLTMSGGASSHARFELMGTTQTLAGVVNEGTGRGVIQNRELAPANNGASTLVLNGGGTYSFNGYVRNWNGTLGVVKDGAGTQTLSGSNITYTGLTTVTGGTLELYNANAFNSATTVNDGAELRLSNTVNLGTPGGFSVALNNGGTLTHNGLTDNNDYVVLNGAVTVSGTTTINQDSVANTTGANKNLFLDGGLKGSGTVTINAANPGNAVVFRNNNTTFAGTMIVNGIADATVNAGSGIGVGGCTTGLTNADITLNGTMELLNRGIGWAAHAPGDFWMGALSGTGVMVGNFTSGGQTRVRIGNTGNDGSFSGTIANGTGNVIVLTKNGAGTQTLAGSGITYTGATTVAAGTLALQDTTAFNSAIAVGPDGTLNASRTALGLANRRPIIGNGITGSGIININNAGSGIAGGWTTVNGGPGSLDFSGTINVNSGVFARDNTQTDTIRGTATVNVAVGAVFGAGRGGNSTIGALNGAGDVSTLWVGSNAGSITLGNGGGSGSFSGGIHGNGTSGTDGTMQGGILSLIKAGAGTQTLTGASTYTGATTINGGTLLVNGSLGDTAVAVHNGGTLGGTGSIGGAVTVHDGGLLSPGASTGVLTMGSLALQPASTTFMEIDGLVRGDEYDGIDIVAQDGLAYGGTLSLAFNLTEWVPAGTVFDLFDFTGTPTGAFDEVVSTGFYAGGAGDWVYDSIDTYSLEFGWQTLLFSHATGDLTVIPEPGTWLLLLSALACGLLVRRRR